MIEPDYSTMKREKYVYRTLVILGLIIYKNLFNYWKLGFLSLEGNFLNFSVYDQW